MLQLLAIPLVLVVSAAPPPENLAPQIREVAEWTDAMKALTKTVEDLERQAANFGKSPSEKLAADLAPRETTDGPTRAEWEVKCTLDELTDARTCSLRSWTVQAQLTVVFVDQRGPFIVPGVPDAPGKSVTVRVDQNQAITFAPGTKGTALAEQLLHGKIVRFEYSRSRGPERAALELAGFAEAYQELIRARGKKGPYSWAASSSADKPKADAGR